MAISGAPLCLQAICVVSPEWVKDAGDLHDPQNPRNRALFDQAKQWAESWAGKGAVFGARLDLDEAGGAVVDPKMAKIGRGTPCHGCGTACHETCNPLKKSKNSTVSNFDQESVEKCFSYKALEASGRLLRQVCRIFGRGGSNAMRQRSSAPLADGCECDHRLPISRGLALTLAAVERMGVKAGRR